MRGLSNNLKTGVAQLDSAELAKAEQTLSEQLKGQADCNDLDASGCLRKLEQHFSQKSHPVLIASFNQGVSDDAESERLFVVSDDWPAAHPSTVSRL